jgi:hypothetical protein
MLSALASIVVTAALAGTASAAGPVFYTKATVGTMAAPVAFTGALGAAFLEGQAGTKITCTAGTSTGEVVNATEGLNGKVTFTGCESSGFPCENGAAKEIKTNTLKGVLGNVVKEKTPGIRLFSQSGGRGASLANFSCASGAIPVEVKGSVIGSLTGASGKTPAEGKLPTSGKLEFSESKGIQKYTKFVSGEGEAGEEQLEAKIGETGFEKSGQSVIATLTSVPKGDLGYTL